MEGQEWLLWETFIRRLWFSIWNFHTHVSFRVLRNLKRRDFFSFIINSGVGRKGERTRGRVCLYRLEGLSTKVNQILKILGKETEKDFSLRQTLVGSLLWTVCGESPHTCVVQRRKRRVEDFTETLDPVHSLLSCKIFYVLRIFPGRISKVLVSTYTSETPSH